MSLKLAARPFKWGIDQTFILTQPIATLGWLAIRAAKNLRNANLNLASKIEIFWGFNLKKPQITDLEKPQRMNPQPQKGWPHPRLKFWGFLRIALKPKFLRILEKPRILSYFWAIFKGFFTNFFEVFRGSSKNLKNLDLILTSSFEVYWG